MFLRVKVRLSRNRRTSNLSANLEDSSHWSGQFIINPYPNLRPFWGGFPY